MDARANNLANLPSRHVTEGSEHAPHRSYRASGAKILKLVAGKIAPRDIVTAPGRIIAENMPHVDLNSQQDVVRAANDPIRATGSVVEMSGNPVLTEAVVKAAGEENLKFTGSAQCFDCVEEASLAVRGVEVEKICYADQ